jgi:hypothetical protein
MNNVRHESTGQFELPLPAAEAIWLFTPEGERVWAPGWNPVYPAGDPSEASGTVFTTAAHGLETIWVIIEIERSGGAATYARLTPGHHAGMVRVRCVDARPGHCTVTVSYDMSLLGDRDASGFDAYAPAHFEDMMRDWSRAIRAYLDGRHS